MTKYVTVNTSTDQGIKKAEWYKSHGYTIFSVGLYTIQFYRKGKRGD